MKTNIHFWSYLVQFFLECKMFQIKVAEKIKTLILCSVIFFSKMNYEMWKNVVEADRPPMIVWRMRIACRHTLRIRNTCFSTLKMVARKSLHILYVHCLSCSFYLQYDRFDKNQTAGTTCEFGSILSRLNYAYRKAVPDASTLLHSVWFCFTHTSRQTERERETDRQTDRQTESAPAVLGSLKLSHDRRFAVTLDKMTATVPKLHCIPGLQQNSSNKWMIG
jgi:hypothetical protein